MKNKFAVEIATLGLAFLSAFAGAVHSVYCQRYDNAVGMAFVALFLGAFTAALWKAQQRIA